MPLVTLKRLAALLVDQVGDRIGKLAGRIVLRRRPQRLDVQAPARSQAAKGVVQLGAGGDQAGVRRAGQIGTPKGQGLLKAAVLVEDQARADQRTQGK